MRRPLPPRPNKENTALTTLPTTDIKFTQASIAREFTDGESLSTLTQALILGEVNVADIDPIRVVKDRGIYYTLDNRRLRVFLDARIPTLNVRMMDLSQPDVLREYRTKKSNKAIDGGGELRAVSYRDDFSTRTRYQSDAHFDSGVFVFTKKILNFTPEQLSRPLSTLQFSPPLPSRFSDEETYYTPFLDLILEEARASLQAGIEALTDARFFVGMLQSVKFANKADNPCALNLRLDDRQLRGVDLIKSGDAFLIQAERHSALRFIAIASYVPDSETTQRISLKVVIDESSRMDSRHFDMNAKWRIATIGSIITFARMYDVCTSRPNVHFLSELLGQAIASSRPSFRSAYVTSTGFDSDDDPAFNDLDDVFSRFGLSHPAARHRQLGSATLSSSARFSSSSSSSSSSSLSAFGQQALAPQAILETAHLNTSQRQAITQFLTRGDKLQFIQGPPGTGKTTTIVTLIQILHAKRERTLVCAPSNKAIQVLVERFIAENPNSAIIIAGVEDKLVGNSLAFEAIFLHTWGKHTQMLIENLQRTLWELDVDSVIANPELLTPLLQAYRALEARLSLYHLTQLEQQAQQAIRSISDFIGLCKARQFSMLESSISPYRQSYHYGAAPKLTHSALCKISLSQFSDRLHQLSADLTRLTQDDSTNGLEYTLLNQAVIIFATLSVAGRQSIREMQTIDTLIVDEAAQSVEPETIIPFIHQPKRALFIGDTKQLPATVISQRATRLGYSRSLMARLVDECHYPYAILDTQYRMHPAISNWPSFQYYQGKLKNDASVSARQTFPFLQRLQLDPYQFIDVNGREVRDNNSYTNPTEVAAIIDFVRYLHAQAKVNVLQDIGIITFYSAQVFALQKALALNRLPPIKISTVDGFQGDENKMIIISFVRANARGAVGFIDDFRRLNVAITRAMHALMIFGDKNTFIKGASDVAKLISDANARGLVIRHQDFARKYQPAPTPTTVPAAATGPRPTVSHTSPPARREAASAISTADPRFKTVPCKFFKPAVPNSCRRGDACTFAHGEIDRLKQIFTPK